MTISHVLVGTDGSKGAQLAVAFAADLAAQLGASVRLVHAFEPLVAMETAKPPVDFAALRDHAREQLQGRWAEALIGAGVAFDTKVVEGPPVEVLVKEAANADIGLVVIGSHGASGWADRIFGRVATGLAASISRPVLTVPLDRPA